MATTITLTGELETRYRADAQREGIAVETLATRRLEEGVLLERIFHSFPPEETREFRSLVAKRGAGTLSNIEGERLTALARRREEPNMAELGIRPARIV